MLKRVMYLAVLAVGFGSSAARADFEIDTFTTPAAATQFSLAGAVGSTYTNTTSLGGGITRVLTVNQIANQNGFAGATSGFFGGGTFSQSTTSGTVGFSSLLYTYATPQNLSNTGTAVTLEFDDVDVDTPFSVRISDGTTTDSQVRVLTTANVGSPFALPLSDFGVNLANITSIEVLVNRDVLAGTSQAARDVDLAEVNISTPAIDPPTPVVPAPPALALFAAAVPVLGLVRRARRKADA